MDLRRRRNRDFVFLGMWLLIGLVLNLLVTVGADIYLHNPRGSNNRLAESTAARANAQRLFNSQNNDKGGYNVGDAGSEPAGNDASKQYQMKYFQSAPRSPSVLMVEWSMQHGCGGFVDVKTPTGRKQRPELMCDIIFQYMCQDDEDSPEKIDQLRTGVSTVSQGHTALPGELGERGPPETYAQAIKRKETDVKLDKGLHESWEWYDKCALRKRNRGIFKADVELDGRTNRFTRQNPRGTQYGYECPAERDYYPYWDPTPWKDIVVLTSSKDLCKRVTTESFSMMNYRYECLNFYPDGKVRKHWNNHNNKKDCNESGGNWTALHNYLEKVPELKTKDECLKGRLRGGLTRIWAIPYDTLTVQEECLVALPAPVCKRPPWTRANHLGNGEEGEPMSFKWKLPYFPSQHRQRCVLRARYNITSQDYDYATINASYNRQPPFTGSDSVPIVEGVDQLLKLQINGQQFGRTFQDRSHVFMLMPRPEEFEGHGIVNLNVRGKRGNIVQTFPGVEYDFVPQHVFLKASDFVHIQWTGSNTHNNKPDGATGGGKDGTDRTNMVQIEEFGDNIPMPWNTTTLFAKARIKWSYFNNTDISPESLALNLASSGFYRCVNASECPNESKEYIYENNPEKLDPLLNNAPASYPGVVLGLPVGEYHIMSTRNNQFSNRSHKKTINVCPFSCDYVKSPGRKYRELLKAELESN